MTLDEIRQQLEAAETLPAAALGAAVANADALAPDVIALMKKAADGVYLMPNQENLVYFGAHALAAARVTTAFPAFVGLLNQPKHVLERLLGHNLPGLLLGLYDGNPDPLFAAIENPKTDGRTKWRLFRALARLAWEGRVSRACLIDLIDRFDREDMAPPGDAAWEGWLEAIMYLGLKEFEGRVRRGVENGRKYLEKEGVHQDWLARLDRAAAHPDDPCQFNDDRVTAITDPVASLAWMAEPEETEQAADSKFADPAERIMLTDYELEWLAGFLASDQAPRMAMSLEVLDGFFTALITGPETIKPTEAMRVIWGDGDSGPDYDSLEQAQFVTYLLVRHWNTIAQRLDGGLPHFPMLSKGGSEPDGREWAHGFVRGLLLRRDAWLPLVRHKEASPALMSILQLIGHEYAGDFQELTPEARTETIVLLPLLIFAIYRFWRDRGAWSAHAEPERSTKVGRNEPCPCGSGRKYKRCCAANIDRTKVA
jgi:uncharacterized protein